MHHTEKKKIYEVLTGFPRTEKCSKACNKISISRLLEMNFVTEENILDGTLRKKCQSYLLDSYKSWRIAVV